MEKKTFEIAVDASKEKVWDVLWGKDTYRKWTAAFTEGSDVETDWQEGSKVLFLDGKGQGMIAMIARNIPNEFMSIKHLGYYKDGVEDTESEQVKKWAGAMENYTLVTVGEQTKLVIDMDIAETELDYFTQVWPKALNKVKELAEG